MSYSEQQARIQEKLWMSHITELSLTFQEARTLLELVANLMDEGLSEDERIVVHFTGGTQMLSNRFVGYQLDTISTILDAETVRVGDDVYKVPRLIEAHRLVEFSQIVHDIMKLS